MGNANHFTFGQGDHMFAANCCDCPKRAHFLGSDQEGIRAALNSSGWKSERSGVIDPDLGEIARFRCPNCAAKT